MRSAVFHLAPTRERLERPHWETGRHWFELSSRAFRADTEPTALAAFDAESFTRRLDLYLNALGVRDRAAVTKLFVLHVDRVELKDGVPVRLYPFTREPESVAPRSVVIDPQIRFGRPTVKGVPTDVIAERWRAGDSPAYLADDYDLTTDEVDEALRFESAPSPFLFLPPFPFLG